MASETILVVEDEEDIQELVRYNLERENYKVVAVKTGEDALKAAKSSQPNLMVLDLMLPGLGGLEVCKALKGDPATKNISIIILSAKGEEEDIIVGLELGADDYITKPFSPKVFLSRVKAVLRRNKSGEVDETEDLRFDDLSIHPGRREVLIKNQLVSLTFTEFSLLHCLARRPGWVFTRNQIVEATRGDDYSVTERSVDTQIVGLRKKMGTASKYIETVRGVGYRFKV